MAHEIISLLSASIAVHVHTSPTPSVPFMLSGTFFCLAYTKAHVSSHCTRFAW